MLRLGREERLALLHCEVMEDVGYDDLVGLT